jgi:hypothetical protein
LFTGYLLCVPWFPSVYESYDVPTQHTRSSSLPIQRQPLELKHVTIDSTYNVTGTYDFFALNYYSLYFVKSLKSPDDTATSEFLYADITASPEWATDDPDFRVRNITISLKTYVSLATSTKTTNEFRSL